MKKYIIYIIQLIIICNIIYMQPIATKASKLTNLEQKQIKQAISLQKIGKFDEAEKIYKNILSKSPFIKEAFIPLKNIYINSNRVNDEIIEYAELYISSNNNDVLKKLDVIDFGEFHDQSDELRPKKHVFFAGKVFVDDYKIPTFVKIFTLVFI